MTHTIPVVSGRLDEALKELQKLARKANRYGNPDIGVAVGDEFTETRVVDQWDGSTRKVSVRFTNLVVSGDPPIVGDHEFLAHIELTPNGNIIDANPEASQTVDTRYRQSTGHCDHCRTERRRRDVYIVLERATGEQLQIGRTCLRDFMGIDDPRRIAQRFAFYRAISECEDDGWGYGGGYSWCQSLEALLELSSVATRLFGWCSKVQAMDDETLTPTVHYVMLGLMRRRDVQDIETWQKIQDSLTDEDRDAAQRCMAWVRDELAGDSDYEHNLKMVFADDLLYNEKRVGLVVSAISAHARAEERDLRRTAERSERAKSGWVGDEGERLREISVVQESSRVIGGSQWGETVLIKFRDEAGNVYCWFTGSGSGLHQGEQAVIDGTVKKHNEYNGAKETQLTRVRVR